MGKQVNLWLDLGKSNRNRIVRTLALSQLPAVLLSSCNQLECSQVQRAFWSLFSPKSEVVRGYMMVHLAIKPPAECPTCQEQRPLLSPLLIFIPQRINQPVGGGLVTERHQWQFILKQTLALGTNLCSLPALLLSVSPTVELLNTLFAIVVSYTTFSEKNLFCSKRGEEKN